MQQGESIGVFPEGTSHTEPHMIPLKDGTSWATLEYAKYLKGTEENGGPKKGRKAVIVPIGRSQYLEHTLNDADGQESLILARQSTGVESWSSKPIAPFTG